MDEEMGAVIWEGILPGLIVDFMLIALAVIWWGILWRRREQIDKYQDEKVLDKLLKVEHEEQDFED
jgi:hypothetical protein